LIKKMNFGNVLMSALLASALVACGGAENGTVENTEKTGQVAQDLAAVADEKEGILALGAKAPAASVKMQNIDGESLSLSDVAGEQGLLVIFSCNTCPFVIGNGTKTEGWEGRYPALYDFAKERGIGMALINPNEAKRGSGDGIDDMKLRYQEQGLKGPYLLDEKHVLADAFGALTTPHVFLFNADMELIYKGAIDDNVDRAGEVKEPYLMNAIEAHTKGEPIDPNSTRQLGCSIKRVKA
jgi:hypothetical protein